MKRTRRLALAALAAAGAGAAVAALWNPPGPPALEINPQQLERARMMEALMVGRGPIGGSFTLTAHDGTRRALSDFRGKVVLLYFGYTQCPDVCPTDLVQIAALLHSLGERAAEVQALYVTVDPERDTAALLAAYLPAFDPRILGLTGGVEEIDELASRYKAYFAKVPLAGGYLMEHSANFYVLDRSGRFAASLPPGTKADRLADVVRERLG